MPSIIEKKKLLRQEAVKNRRQAYQKHPAYHHGLLRQFQYYSQNQYCYQRVGFYWAMGSEIDARNLVVFLETQGVRLALPVIDDRNTLQFHAYQMNDKLQKNVLGFLEPETMSLVAPDLIFIPLLAGDKRCVRLGLGGGYYDRFLSSYRKVSSVQAVGLAYDEQIVESLPCEVHDEQLDVILTPTQIITNSILERSL